MACRSYLYHLSVRQWGTMIFTAPVKCVDLIVSQAIIWTNDGISLIGLLWTSFNEILIKIHFFIHENALEMSSAKWRPFRVGLNDLKRLSATQTVCIWYAIYSARIRWSIKTHYIYILPPSFILDNFTIPSEFHNVAPNQYLWIVNKILYNNIQYKFFKIHVYPDIYSHRRPGAYFTS